MARFASPLIATSLSTLVLLAASGCGSKSNENASIDGSRSSASQSNVAANGNTVTSPSDVVSQFLDLVRRGGQDSGAGSLLTAKAQSELTRIGRSVQPIGSPNARFNVTRAEMIPDQPGAALVHSIWSEPNAEGSGETGATIDSQIVWALELESAGWRISGLAMELDPSQNPLIIDFENGQRMAQLLDGTPSDQPGSSTGGETLTR